MSPDIKYTFVDGDSVPNLKCDGITPELIAITEAKFKCWDEVIETGRLESEDEEDQAYVYGLLDDPTIYAYAFFRNVDGNPIKMYPYQDVVLNDPHKRILVPSSNQAGKSFSLCIKALTFAIKNPGSTTLLVSKSVFQAKDLPKQMRDLLKMSILDYKSDLGTIDTKTEIYIKHFDDEGNELLDSRIICAPATDSALGFPVDLLLLDELAFYTEPDGTYFWQQVAQPRLYKTKGQAICYSNPNGKNNILYDMWLSPNFHKYRFTFLDNPANTKEEFDAICSELPQERIDSTLMAKFSSSEGSYFTVAEINAMQEDRSNILPPPSEITEPFWIVYDFAKVNDRTVVYTGHGTKDNGVKGLHSYEYPQGTGYDIIIDDLKDIIEAYGSDKIAGVGYDGTGVGKGIEDFMKIVENMGVMLTPIAFTLKSKSEMATLVKLLAEKNLREPDKESGIKVPKDAEFNKQMNRLVFKRTASGQLQVHHEKESDRDDHFDALMMLCRVVMNLENVPVTMEVAEKEVKKMIEDSERCECGNILSGEEFCTFCGKEVINWFV
jgi:hypothetical protein